MFVKTSSRLNALHPVFVAFTAVKDCKINRLLGAFHPRRQILPRALTPTELAFGTEAGPRSVDALADRLEQGFLRQLEPLPAPSRVLLLTAAADPTGDVPLLWRAVDRLPRRQRQLVLAMSATPPPPYEELAQRLSMPVGSIGPTRARALHNLRRLLENLVRDA